MSRREPTHPTKRRRLGHAAIVCFSASAIAFVACAMGLFVNHMLTGSLAISGTAAVGLIYLAMGLLNLNRDDVSQIEVVVRPAADNSGSRDPEPPPFARDEFSDPGPVTPVESSELVSSSATPEIASRE